MLIDIPARLKAEFERDCAPASFDDFGKSVAAFVAYRDHDDSPPPAKLRDELARLVEQTDTMIQAINDLCPAARDSLAVASSKCGFRGDPAFSVRNDLRMLASMAEVARRSAEAEGREGRPMDLKLRLALSLANVIEAADLPLSAAAGGPLAKAFSIALAVAEEAPERPDKILAAALARRRKIRPGDPFPQPRRNQPQRRARVVSK